MIWPDLQPDEQQTLEERTSSPPRQPPVFDVMELIMGRETLPPLLSHIEKYIQKSSNIKVSASPLPPSYIEEPTQPITYETLTETPQRTPICNSPIAPTASQTSNDNILSIEAELENTGEELENNREGLKSDTGPDDRYFAMLQARALSLDREDATFDTDALNAFVARKGLEHEIDADEEHYANLHAQELSQAGEIGSGSKTLSSQLTQWLLGAMTIYSDPPMHSRLRTSLFRTQNRSMRQ